MTDRILVMGAAGRLGFAAAEAFQRAGWDTRGLVRPGRAAMVPRGVESIEAVTRAEAVAAAEGCAIVLNALNPVITQWEKNALSLAYGAIAAAEENGATLMFPGNLWNFGSDMPPVVDGATPPHPSTRKGAMRVEIEQRISEACDRGMRAVILRSGDFFGGGVGSWLDLVITKELKRQRLTYPGPLQVEHSWAYLPDYTAALVRLAAERATLPAFASFGFPGHTLMGRELIDSIEATVGARCTLRPMSWWFIKSIGRLLALGRELAELEYLWRVPHQIDGSALQQVIGKIPQTPLPKAMRSSLRALGHRV